MLEVVATPVAAPDTSLGVELLERRRAGKRRQDAERGGEHVRLVAESECPLEDVRRVVVEAEGEHAEHADAVPLERLDLRLVARDGVGPLFVHLADRLRHDRLEPDEDADEPAGRGEIEQLRVVRDVDRHLADPLLAERRERPNSRRQYSRLMSRLSPMKKT